MLPALVFFRASVFNVRTSEADQERRLEFLGINYLRLDTTELVSSRIFPKRKGENAKPIASIDVFYFCECSSEAQNRVGHSPALTS